MKEKKKKYQGQTIIRNIFMKFALENNLFFGKVIVGYKN